MYIDKKIRKQKVILMVETHFFLLPLDFNFMPFFLFSYYLISVVYNTMILLFSLYYDFVIFYFSPITDAIVIGVLCTCCIYFLCVSVIIEKIFQQHQKQKCLEFS